jgi:hypothetical protein
MVLIELKQWSNERVADSDSNGNLVVDVGTVRKVMLIMSDTRVNRGVQFPAEG